MVPPIPLSTLVALKTSPDVPSFMSTKPQLYAEEAVPLRRRGKKHAFRELSEAYWRPKGRLLGVASVETVQAPKEVYV